jgi:hypothetical protein
VVVFKQVPNKNKQESKHMSNETLPTEEFQPANPSMMGDEGTTPLFTDPEVAHSVANLQKHDEEVMALQRKGIAEAEPGSYDGINGSHALARNELSDEYKTAALKEAHDAIVAARPQTIEAIEDNNHPDTPQEVKDRLNATTLSEREDEDIRIANRDARRSDPYDHIDKNFDKEVVARAEAIQAREETPTEERKAA